MKYAIQYSPNFRHLLEVDEIIFESFDDIREYAGTGTPEQTYIYHLPQPQDNVKDIIELKNELNINNLTIALTLKNTKKEILDTLKENNISYMFLDFARTKEMVDAMGQMGACSIYIVEELAFNLKALQYMREKYGFTYRVFPDIAQHSKNLSLYVPSLQRFFIRPEDTEVYEKYVDIFEFWRNDDRLSVIYEIYKQQQWLGDLQDIVIGLEKSIDNKTIAPHFGQMRTECDKICLCGRCNLCEELEKLAEQFEAAGLEIVKKRKKPIRTKEETEEKINKLVERGKDIINESSTDEENM